MTSTERMRSGHISSPAPLEVGAYKLAGASKLLLPWFELQVGAYATGASKLATLVTVSL